MKRRNLMAGSVVAVVGAGQMLAPPAYAAPAPEVEYTYNVTVRRHYDFPNDDATGYGYGICDKLNRGEGYVQVTSEVKNEVLPNDEFAANYLISHAVGILCPPQVWKLRNSAAHS